MDCGGGNRDGEKAATFKMYLRDFRGGLVVRGFFPSGSAVKNMLTMQETWVRSLGGEDPLEEDMANRSSILAWRIPTDTGAWWAAVHRVT